MTGTVVATRPASPFGANLRAALGATSAPRGAEAIAVDKIDEAEAQPRSDFGDLEALAASVRLVGVLQPVGVRAGEGGRYRMVYGARRLRASKLAEKTTIPVHFVRDDQVGLTAQVIENQHRKALTNSEVAKAVNALTAEGMTKDDICRAVNIQEYRFWYYRAFEKMPEWMVKAADGCELRAIYDLYTAWKDLDGDKQADLRSSFEALLATSPEQTVGAAKLTDLSGSRPELKDLHGTSAEPEAETPVRKAGRKIARNGEAKPRLGLKVECRRLRSIVSELLAELSKTRRAAMERRIQEIMSAPEGGASWDAD